MTTRPREYVDPATLMRIKSLELRAKHVVEGFWNGLNRSPCHGFSVEFSEYRRYTPGDDPRYLDWRLFARSDRYYVKRFEDETNLRCHLVVDASKSMGYGSLDYSKFEYARTLVATLAYFLVRQRDAVGLLRFDETVDGYVAPRFRPGQLRSILVELERPLSGRSTDLSQSLERIAERASKRGMLVLVSDLLVPLDDFHERLGQLVARRHDVVVFQVLDPAECRFEFDTPALFEDVETDRRVYVDPAATRRDYLARFEEHQARIRAACDAHGATYRLVVTDEPLDLALAEFLRNRQLAGPVGVRRRTNSRGGRP